MRNWIVKNSPFLVSAILIIALLATVSRSAIQSLVGLAVAGPNSQWINVNDASVGTPLASGLPVHVPYVYNGVNYDALIGDATNGAKVNVTKISGSVGGNKTPADAYAVPTDGIDTLGFLMGFNGTTYDRIRSIANNADGVATTTLGILPTGSYLYGFNGTTWDRLKSEGNNADAVATSTLGSWMSKAYEMLFNGTSWDRKRSAGVGNNVASTGLGANVSYGQYQTTPGTITSGNYVALQTDSLGNLRTSSEGDKATYSASVVGLVIPASATDIFTLTGSASKTIRVTRIQISGIATAAAATPVTLLKRSTADSGGTSTAPTVVPHDSTNAAGTGTVLAYTVNPTTGTLVGIMETRRATFTTSAGAIPNIPTQFDFERRGEQAIVLRGTGQVFAINLNAVTVAGLTVDVDITWTEE